MHIKIQIKIQNIYKQMKNLISQEKLADAAKILSLFNNLRF